MRPDILQYFTYEHLPPHLQEISKVYADQAQWLVDNVSYNAELSTALRKLLESKDAAVRAAITPIK